METIILN